MPELSRFLGVVICMYYREHAPPHFHAEYGEFEITVDIHTGIVTGRFPRRALYLVLARYRGPNENFVLVSRIDQAAIFSPTAATS